MSLALTRTLHPADFELLERDLPFVDQYFTSASEQHPLRRWEYALALHAIWRWQGQQTKQTQRTVDVGGAGSPFRNMIYGALGRGDLVVVDPAENYDLASYMADLPRLSPVVTCLSVIEHIPSEELDRFLYHLGCLVAPGGILFLTADVCGHDRHALDIQDPHHFSWMRSQIFTPTTLRDLVWGYSLKQLGFDLFGEADWAYHGDHVYDYSFASLCLQKRA